MFGINKKILVTVLFMAFFSIGVSLNSTKASNKITSLSTGITLDLVPSATTVNLGQQFYVNVTISGVEASHDLVGIEFRFKWDTTLLTATKIEMPSGHVFKEADDDGNMWVVKKTLNDAIDPNTAWLIVTCSDLQQGYNNGYLPLTTTGVVAKVTFNASETNEGTSSIYWVQGAVNLSTGGAQPISDFVSVDTEVAVVPEFSTSTAILALMTASIFATVACGKLKRKLSSPAIN